MRRPSQEGCRARAHFSSARGFTFAEVMVALALTAVIMGAVFGFLARGVTTNRTEPDRTDMQTQARQALELISRDVLLAGAGLPPEFPAFTLRPVNPRLMASDGDTIEIVGNIDQDVSGEEPIRMLSFDGQTALLEVAPAGIGKGDLVLLYDDAATQGTWIFGVVSQVHLGANPAVNVRTSPGAAADTPEGVELPAFINNYNRPLPASGYLTPVTVVTYTTARGAGNGDSEKVLWRGVNWAEPTQVASVENLQIRYFVGSTIDEVTIPPDRGPGDLQQMQVRPRFSEGAVSSSSPRDDSGSRDGSGPRADSTPSGRKSADPPSEATGSERELADPPMPQPDPLKPVGSAGLVRGVRITVTSRSRQANLEGATVPLNQTVDENGYLRVTYSSRITTRNLLFRLSARGQLGIFN